MSKRANRWRAAAAKAMQAASSVPEGSYRDIIISTADAYSRLADEEERRARAAAKVTKTKSAPAEEGR
jgi:hypothetical protein